MAILGCRGASAPAARPGGDVEAAAAVCARVASCAHPHDPARVRDPSACVDWWLSHGSDPDEPIACLNSATDCPGVDRCLHEAGDPRAMSLCASHPGSLTLCDGSQRIACGGDDITESTRTDCAAIGATCGETHGSGGLMTYSCISSSLCPPEVTRASCDGPKTLLSCHEGSFEKVACPDGTTCHAHTHGDGAEFAMCEGEGHVTCDAPGSRKCDGDTLIECEAHGHYGHARATDCRALGLACVDTGGRVSCLSHPATCAPGSVRCAGESLSFCAAGRPAKVSCASLGLGPCDPDARGLEAGCKVANGLLLR